MDPLIILALLDKALSIWLIILQDMPEGIRKSRAEKFWTWLDTLMSLAEAHAAKLARPPTPPSEIQPGPPTRPA